MDEGQVTRFFGLIYNSGQSFELVAVKGGQARRKTFVWPSDTPTILAAIEKFEDLEYNVYASVLPLEQQEKGEYDRLWFDRDDPAAPWPFGGAPEWTHEPWPTPRTLVRTSFGDSGVRFQAIWRLENSLPEDAGRRAIKQLAKIGTGDEAVHDPRRVLRIPGVINAKRQDLARLLATSEELVTPERFYIYPEFQETSIDSLLNMELTRPHEVLGEWLAGVSEGDRARKAFVTARFLRSCGVGRDDATIIVATGARRSSPPLSDDEVLHAIDSAYSKGL